MEAAADQRIINIREGLLDVAGFAVSPFTYDADIVLDLALLSGDATIIDAKAGAGFNLIDQPGLYRRA